MTLKLGFVMDPLEDLHLVQLDTTVGLMLEAQARGHELGYITLEDLFVKDDKAYAESTMVQIFDRAENFYEKLERKTLALSEFDVLFMRKNPPVDLDYIYATYILDLAKDESVIINDPTGIRSACEKIYSLNFPELIPPSIVAKTEKRILEFIEDVGGIAVAKPLNQCSGKSVCKIDFGDEKGLKNLKKVTNDYTTFVLIQKFIPEVADGDRRIMMLGGEPIGAMNRVPPPGGFLANVMAGGTAHKWELTEKDYQICARIEKKLVSDGLSLVGIDVIGDYVTEINVTSPAGTREITNFDGINSEALVIDYAEKRAASRT